MRFSAKVNYDIYEGNIKKIITALEISPKKSLLYEVCPERLPKKIIAKCYTKKRR